MLLTEHETILNTAHVSIKTKSFDSTTTYRLLGIRNYVGMF